MSTEVKEILAAIRALPAQQKKELASALSQETLVIPATDRKALVSSIRGKYANLPTNSEGFMARRRDELSAEN